MAYEVVDWVEEDIAAVAGRIQAVCMDCGGLEDMARAVVLDWLGSWADSGGMMLGSRTKVDVGSEEQVKVRNEHWASDLR